MPTENMAKDIHFFVVRILNQIQNHRTFRVSVLNYTVSTSAHS